MSTRQFGERVKRNADPKLLKGEGRFTDDIPLAGALHAVFVRSPIARAKILEIDVSEARALPGVVAVYTCDDIGHLDQELPMLIPHDCMVDPRTARPLARDDVYYVGQPVVMIVAIDRYVAEDALQLVDIDYDPMGVEMEIEEAVKDGAPLVHPNHPNNIDPG